MLGVLKRNVELALVSTRLPDLWRRLSGRNGVILAYHNVLPDEGDPAGDTSLHLPLSRFRTQLDLFSRTHSIVPLTELIQASPRGGKPLGAITFDDAYRGALELGIPELSRRGIPATIFVAPALLGEEGFWWDRIADPKLGAVPSPLRQTALRDLGGRQDAILDSARAMGVCYSSLPRLYHPSTEKELVALARHPLITLGSHTWSHVHLTSVPLKEAREELRRSLAWLQAFEVPRPYLLSYPYGGAAKGIKSLVHCAGYQAAFLIRGGALRTSSALTDPMAIPRLNVSRGLSNEGFQACLSGLWPG